MANNRLTLAFELLGAIEDAGLTADDLRMGADALTDEAAAGRLIDVANAIDALAWLRGNIEDH